MLDQILSIVSFVKAIGRPKKWILYSDGSHSDEHGSMLSEIQFLTIESDVEGSVWQEKKYNAFSRHELSETTVFLDSDILFFEPFAQFVPYLKRHGWVLPENKGAICLDDDYTTASYEYLTAINSGFFVLNERPNWIAGYEYLRRRIEENKLSHFSEQTAINIVFENATGLRALDPRYFVLTLSDMFCNRLHEPESIAMRHYVGPIRHKMYLSFAKNYGTTASGAIT